MKCTRGLRNFLVAIFFVLLLILIDTVESKDSVDTDEEDNRCKMPADCPEFSPLVDWRTEQAKHHCPRRRLTEDHFMTAVVVIGAILIILANLLLCFLLWDEHFWGQRTYRWLFSLACNDCITGILLVFGVVTEMKSVQEIVREYTGGSPVLCKIVIAGLWLCVVPSIYTFTVISVARWLMLNHPTYYKDNLENKPMWWTYIGIASCWLAGACHAVPLLTPWNNECVTDFTTCSLPYKNPVWITSTAITVFIIPSLIIVVGYSLILYKIKARNLACSTRTDDRLAERVTKIMSILTAAFLLVWWPLCIFLSIRWNTKGGTRGFYAGAISCLANPVLIISLNSQLKNKVVAMFRHFTCSKK